MEQTSSAWKIAVAVLAVIAAAFTAYNVGWSNAQAEYEAMADLNVLLNRSDMETIELIDGPVYVFGHQSPDADTVCSAIAYAELLCDLGYDARPLGSTATIILIRYYNYGFEPTPQTAKLMLGALLSDTSNL